MTSQVDYGDVQGLVRFAHAHMTEACYFLVRIKNAIAARAWLAKAPVTSAAKLDRLPETALQIAFSRQGLEALGVAPSVLAGFSAEFISGMNGSENRSMRLGDTGTNSPSYWQWGTGGRFPHAVVMLFAMPGLLDSWKSSLRTDRPVWGGIS